MFYQEDLNKISSSFSRDYKKVVIFERAVHKQLYLTIRLRARNFYFTIIHRSRGDYR